MLNHLGWLFLALAAPLCCTRGAATQVAAEQNAVYATQSTFETSSPIIYTTSGICIESAVRAKEKIEVFLPPVAEILAPEFVGLASNLAYVVDFRDNRPAFASSANTFTIDTRAVTEAELSVGVWYNVTVADVSVGVQYNIASASCHLKMGYA